MAERMTADGGTRIWTERTERGWTRRKLAQKLRESADPRDVPGLDSLTHNIYRWERGAAVSERYRILYCRVFNRGERELFGYREPAPAASNAPASAGAGNADDGLLTVRLPRGAQRISIDVTISADSPSEDTNTGPARRLTAVKSGNRET